MTKRGNQRRGQPIYALGGLVSLWMAGRVIAIILPGSVPADMPQVNFPPASELVVKQGAGQENATLLSQTHGVARPMEGQALTPMPSQIVPPYAAQQHLLPGLGPLAPAVEPSPLANPVAMAPVAPARPNPSLAGGHQLLFLAAFSQIPIPAELLPQPGVARQDRPKPAERPATRRWSGDGWLLLRRGGGVPVLAAIGGAYGASQAGMVLRYRIDSVSAHRPSAYLRTSAALSAVREQEVALGFAARPIARLPVIAMAEARAMRTPTGTRARPALALVTEIPPVALPLRLKAEAYGQAGWVGGSGATAFVDGQMRLERRLARLGGADISAGGGMWGGAQKDASRLDAGPTARITLHPTEQSTLRVAADWRFRVAGKAAPQSGPAITLSAGF